MKVNIGELNNQLIIDIIAILSYYFEDVYIVRTPLNNILAPYKNLVCNNFKGISKEKLDELYEISKKWNILSNKCSIDILDIETDKFYISSILDYKNSYPSIIEFNNLEYLRKSKYFNKIISTYNDLMICGDEVIKKEEEKRLSSALKYLQMNGIDINVKYREINNRILKDDLYIDFDLFKKKQKFNTPIKDKIKIRIKEERYNIEELEKLENNLKYTKRILDTFDWERYSKIKQITKKLKLLKKYVSDYFGTDISQAFLKMFEILSLYDLIKEKKEFNSFHFCELPGQFILATNYYLETRSNNKHHWMAQSLNPKLKRKTEIFGDVYDLIKDNPDNWDFGADKSGDITKDVNIRYYKKHLSQADLITSDCGLDMRDPTKATYQDKELAYINFCQILMVLNGIKIGAHYVGKVFLPQTVSYIIGLNYLLCQSFKEVYIHKTAINAGSSEVYIVCKNFKGIEEEIVEELFKVKKDLDLNKTFVEIPQSFLDNYSEVMSIFIQRNINHIKTNIYYYDNETALSNLKNYQFLLEKNVENWLKFFKF